MSSAKRLQNDAAADERRRLLDADRDRDDSDEEDEEQTHLALSFAKGERFKHFVERFDAFCQNLSTEAGGLEILERPGCADSASYFCQDAPSPNYPTLRAFVDWMAASTAGKLADVITRDYAHKMIQTFRDYYHHTTGRWIDKDVRLQIRSYVKTDMDNVTDLERPHSWSDIHIMERVGRTFLHPSFYVRKVRTRWQALLWQSLLMSDSLRGGSLLPRSKRDKAQRGLRWGDIELTILRDENGGPNHIIPNFVTPNAKNDASRNTSIALPERELLWVDACFQLLVLSKFAETFPKDWTYEMLLDPTSLPEGQDHLILAFDKPTESIFLGSVETDDIMCDWTTSTPLKIQHHVAEHLGLDQALVNHVYRRSGVIAGKIKGIEHDRLQAQLRQIYASQVIEVYIGNIKTADATAAVYDTESNVEATLGLHPERIRETRGRIVLGSTQIAKIASDDYLNELLIQSMAVREEQLEKYGCKRVAKLPKGARRLVKTSYQRYSKQWSRLVAYEKSLIAQSAIHRLGETAQSGDDKPESDAEFSRAGSPSSDDDRDGASGSASGGAVGGASGDAVGGASGDADRDGEADEQPEAGEAGSLDAFPSGEAAEYDAAAALEFMLDNPFRDPSNVMQIASVYGYVDDSDTARVNQVVEADFAQHVLDKGLPAIAPLPTFDEIDPLLRDEGIEDESDGQALIMAPADLSFKESYGLISKVASVLFDGPCQDRVSAFNLCITLPDDSSAVFGYRPGEAPLEGQCKTCGKTIAQCIAGLKEDAEAGNARKALKSHIQACAAEAARAAIGDILLAKYPFEIPVDPFTLKRPQTRQGVTAKFTAANYAAKLKHSLETKKSRTIVCKGCPNEPVFSNTTAAQAHVLAEHGYFTLVRKTKTDNSKTCLEVTDFPIPTWYEHLGVYVADPQQLEYEAELFVNSRVYEASESVTGYGQRRDISYGAQQRVIWSDDSPEPPCDDKYSRLVTIHGRLVRDPLCMLCATNPDKAWSVRGNPHNVGTHAINYHTTSCLRETLLTLMSYRVEDRSSARKSEKHRHHLWRADGSIPCPDPVCMDAFLVCPDMLSWVRHLVSVHNLRIPGRLGPQGHAKCSLNQLSFTSEADLQAWMVAQPECDVRVNKIWEEYLAPPPSPSPPDEEEEEEEEDAVATGAPSKRKSSDDKSGGKKKQKVKS